MKSNNNENFIIDDYQLSIMKYKEKLNFEECLNSKSENKSEFNKKIRNYLDIYYQTLSKNGTLFFGFTINFPEAIGLQKEAWEMVHYRVEEFIRITAINIELCEFVYLSIEKHDERQIEREEKYNEETKQKKQLIDISTNEQRTLKGLPHIHGIIGIRSLIGKNADLLLQITKFYQSCYNDILIKELRTNKQIKGYWNYVIKENNYKYQRFANFSKFFENEVGTICDLELILDHQEVVLGTGLITNGKNNDIYGIGSNKKVTKNILLYLINLYFHLKGIYVYKNELYIKNENSKFSWKMFDKISYIRENNLKILSELKTLFPQQLINLDIFDLVLSSFELLYNEISKYNHYLPTINLNSSIIEFLDGLYFLDHNYFFDFHNNKEKTKELTVNCFKYFDKTYSYCRKNKPIQWLNAIRNNFADDAELEDFCSNLGTYFHTRQLVNNKKKTICIKGDSNTGKTTLVAKILTEMIGLENIGIISNTGDTFAFEQVEDKKIIICDEFKYSTVNREDLIKILDNDPLLINKKAVTKKMYINKAPILFMFNNNVNNKMLEDQAFINRLLIYTFTFQVTKQNPEIDKILINELPNIMLYCNQLFFEKHHLEIQDQIYEKKHRKKSIKTLLQNYIKKE